MKYDVTIRHIREDGFWEEWVSWVDADDKVAALAKLLRRRGVAERILEGERFRCRVSRAGEDT